MGKVKSLVTPISKIKRWPTRALFKQIEIMFCDELVGTVGEFNRIHCGSWRMPEVAGLFLRFHLSDSYNSAIPSSPIAVI
jgi:hypothetical protein